MTKIIDCHQHFWKRARGDYGWLTEDLGVLYADYGPEDLLPQLAKCGVSQTILVQAAPTVDETRYLLDLARRFEFIAGVVGWVDMEDVEAGCTALDVFSLDRKFVGIRPMLQDLEDTHWICRPSLRPAIERLVETQLCFDALVKPQHLPSLLEFLKRETGLKCVIDHGAKPGISAGDWQPWADHIQALAEETSAFCKLSGLLTEARDDQGYDSLAPYVQHLLQTFGAKRLMWGSDWPVVRLRAEYADWFGMSQELLIAIPDEDREQILAGTATRFYGLDKEQPERRQ